MEIRFAKKEELDEVNVIRSQVGNLHAKGRPDIFQAEFNGEIRDIVFEYFNDETRKIIVAVENGEVCGMATIHEVHKPESPYQLARDFLEVEEFGVKDTFRRQGIATKLMEFIKEYAREKGFKKLELNMWEFNQGALDFYEAVGFKTYRRYMEMKL